MAKESTQKSIITQLYKDDILEDIREQFEELHTKWRVIASYYYFSFGTPSREEYEEDYTRLLNKLEGYMDIIALIRQKSIW